MGVAIIREVRDYGPLLGLSDGALLVLWVLAEDANDITRECWPGMPALMHRSNNRAKSTVRRLLTELVDDKIIRRLPAPSYQPGAAPVVAHRGHRTVYRIETLALAAERLSETKALAAEPLKSDKGAQQRAQRRPVLGSKAPAAERPPVSSRHVPSPGEPTGSAIEAVRAVLLDRTGRDVGDEWAARVAAQLLDQRGRQVARPDRWLRAVLEREIDLQPFLPGPTY